MTDRAFKRVYAKLAAMAPGDENPLTEGEMADLLRRIRAHRARCPICLGLRPKRRL